MDRRVTDEMNDRLLQPFKEEEISKALSQMHPLKSSGPVGYPAVFYQKSWTSVGKEVRQATLQFLNEGPL
jgi:hypothetical protein